MQEFQYSVLEEGASIERKLRELADRAADRLGEERTEYNAGYQAAMAKAHLVALDCIWPRCF